MTMQVKWKSQGFGLASTPTAFCPKCGCLVHYQRKDDHVKVCFSWWDRFWGKYLEDDGIGMTDEEADMWEARGY